MKLRFATMALLLLCASGAIAADMFPLRRGIYVRVGTPCVGASNVNTLSYWGADNGINGQQTGCKIESLRRNGSVYSLDRRCEQLRFGGYFNDHVTVLVHNQTSFEFRRRGALEVLPRGTNLVRTYRYCGPKVQF